MVTRDEIFETFWPGLPTKEATNVFHVTKRKISERLGYELTSSAIEHAPSSGGGKGLDLSDRTKVWLCVILLGVIVYFVRRR